MQKNGTWLEHDGKKLAHFQDRWLEKRPFEMIAMVWSAKCCNSSQCQSPNSEQLSSQRKPSSSPSKRSLGLDVNYYCENIVTNCMKIRKQNENSSLDNEERLRAGNGSDLYVLIIVSKASSIPCPTARFLRKLL